MGAGEARPLQARFDAAFSQAISGSQKSVLKIPQYSDILYDYRLNGRK
jgi:hypothetical protein